MKCDLQTVKASHCEGMVHWLLVKSQNQILFLTPRPAQILQCKPSTEFQLQYCGTWCVCLSPSMRWLGHTVNLPGYVWYPTPAQQGTLPSLSSGAWPATGL